MRSSVEYFNPPESPPQTGHCCPEAVSARTKISTPDRILFFSLTWCHIFIDLTVSHHKDHPPQGGNVFDWIPVYRDQIGIHSLCECPDLISQCQRFRRCRGNRSDCVAGALAPLLDAI